MCKVFRCRCHLWLLALYDTIAGTDFVDIANMGFTLLYMFEQVYRLYIIHTSGIPSVQLTNNHKRHTLCCSADNRDGDSAEADCTAIGKNRVNENSQGLVLYKPWTWRLQHGNSLLAHIVSPNLHPSVLNTRDFSDLTFCVQRIISGQLPIDMQTFGSVYFRSSVQWCLWCINVQRTRRIWFITFSSSAWRYLPSVYYSPCHP